MINKLKQIKEKELEDAFKKSIEIDPKLFKTATISKRGKGSLKTAILSLLGAYKGLSKTTRCTNLIVSVIIIIIFVFAVSGLFNLIQIAKQPKPQSAALENMMRDAVKDYE